MNITMRTFVQAGLMGLAPIALAACGGAVPEESTAEMAAPAAAEAMAPTVDAGIRNVSILHVNVANMDRAVAWYQGVLGMETVRDNGGPSPTSIVAEEGAMMHTHVIETPGGDFQMELVEVSGIELRPQSARIQDPGAVMLAMVVDDLDGVLAGARELGLQVLSTGGEVVVTEARGRQVMVRDSDGFVSYLTQSTELDAAEVLVEYTFVSVADLEETVNFYNGVFGMGMETPGEPGSTSERILALVGDSTLTLFRLTADYAFPGTRGALRFQEFRGVDRTAVRHRVQDPGGPILTMTVEDFAGVMERVEAYGGTIGDGEVSTALEPNARVSWIRDPNGLLIRVSAPPPAD